MAILQDILKINFGKKSIESKEIPSYITNNLSPTKPLRPYQREALQYALTYFDEEEFEEKEPQTDLLFQMATGAGKTLMMAAMILLQYKRGYRNFLFFVNTNNIIGKTEENFFNPSSNKYLFADKTVMADHLVELNMVSNFQHVNPNAINICLTTIQQLHTDLTNPKEGGLTFDDFMSLKTVMISDEAHHINSNTKKGKKANNTGAGLPDLEPSWENTAMRIFNSNRENILLEFTATSGIDQDPNLRKKYEPKLIYNYALKQFRMDGYSKEVETIQETAEPKYRALSAVVISQFKLKLFESIGLCIKPVIMFKSKTIKDNSDNHKQFGHSISHLTIKDLNIVKSFAKDDLQKAFEYFEEKGISLDNLLLEIKEDFSSEKLLIVDQNNIDKQKQITLNTLEAEDNIIRCVFAVDMLNEGWDVLNLFDIVRMYDTRDAKNGKPGKTTIQEAQLIGRGARYMPFIYQNSPIQADKRKFDNDIENPLRVIEKLHYHTATNSRYIDELRKALIESGIADETHKTETIKLKSSFKETDLYQKGYVFVNERKKYEAPKDNNKFPEEVLNYSFSVNIAKRSMKSDDIFNKVEEDRSSTKYGTTTMYSLGKHVIRTALNTYPEYSFNHIKKAYPPIKSIEEFITNKNFLADLKIDIHGESTNVSELSQKQKLVVAQNVLKQLAPMIFKRLDTYIGTKQFKQRDFKATFKDHSLKFALETSGSEKEFGVSMKTPHNPALRLDLNTCEWYAYDDCFGTSEEKFLIKYIESIIDKLKEKYSEIYLVRNELDLKLYAFNDGSVFEPDFVLFMKHKESEKLFDNIQIFIEPKGAQLEKKDKWKEDFLCEINNEEIITVSTHSDKFKIWGLPFFNEAKKQIFDKSLKSSLELAD